MIKIFKVSQRKSMKISQLNFHCGTPSLGASETITKVMNSHLLIKVN